MAQVLPRLTHDNNASAPTAVVTASSEQVPVYGVGNLRDPTPTRTWRSKLGWNIVSGFNTELRWQESGVTRVATVSVGNRASGTTMAAAVQTAMNTAPGVLNTYTVTYNTGSKVFTIARASGSQSVQYLFGQSFQNSIAKDLGFIQLAPSGNSVSSDSPVYKSRETINYAVVGFGFYRSAFLINVNFPSNRAYFQHASASPVFENILPLGSDQFAGDTRIQAVSTPDNSFGYGRVLIEDQHINTAGYSEVGIVHFGPFVSPARGIVPGWRQRALQLGAYAISDTGTVFRDVKAQPRSWDVEWRRLRETDRNALVAFQNAVGVGGSFIFQFDPLNDPLDSYYVYLTSALEFTQRVGDGVPPDRYDVAGFSMTEHL
jgi:hypothetical protein